MLQMARKFDELNAPMQFKRSEPFETYFGDMDLTDKEKEKRIQVAEDLDDLMLFLFALISLMRESNSIDKDYIALQINNRYTEILQRYMGIDKYLKDYIRHFSDTFIQTTFGNIDNEWYLSADRSKFIAENESNNVFSHDEYVEALKDGKTKKRWITMKDKRVRHSHRKLDERILEISDQFVVGDSLMNFPRDEEFLPNPSQVVSCRCSIKYF